MLGVPVGEPGPPDGGWCPNQGGVELDPPCPCPIIMLGGVLLEPLSGNGNLMIGPHIGGRGQSILPLGVSRQNIEAEVELALPIKGIMGGVELPLPMGCITGGVELALELWGHGVINKALSLAALPLPVLIANVPAACWPPLPSLTQKTTW